MQSRLSQKALTYIHTVLVIYLVNLLKIQNTKKTTH